MARAQPGPWLMWVALLIGVSLIFIGGVFKNILNDGSAFDTAAVLALRMPSDPSQPIGPAWLKEAARNVTSLGSVTVVSIISGALVGYLLLTRQHKSALLILASVVGTLALNDSLKFVFDRPRPDLVFHSAQVFTSSFPSGHAALSSAAYLTMGALLAQKTSFFSVRGYVFAVAIVLTVLVGTSRVYLGLHYPTDVIAGWCIGSGWALICWLVASRASFQRAEHQRQNNR